MTIPNHGAPAPPPTRRDDVRETIHGVEVVDPYRWLEDQDSPETRAWLEAQNAYTQSVLGELPGREALEARLAELMKLEVVGLPVERGGVYFYPKRRPEDEQFILYRRRGARGKDEVLIDPHPMSADHTTSVVLMDVSDDGALVAYGVRVGGEDEVETRFRDVECGEDVADVLAKGRLFSLSIDPQNRGIYYTRHTEEGNRVYRHEFGADPGEDTVIFGEGYGPETIVSTDLFDDGRRLLITVSHGSAAAKTEIYLYDTSTGKTRTIVNDVEAQFHGYVAEGIVYLKTNWDAPNGRIVTAHPSHAGPAQWREVVPEGRAAMQSFSLAGGRLLVTYLHNVSSRIRMFSPKGEDLGDMRLPGIGSSDAWGRWDSDEATLTFTSFTRPLTIYRYNVQTGARRLWARTNAPIQPADYVTKQVWYTSKDGTRVPMFLVHRKGLRRDGRRPTVLYGYGGFQVSLTPGFSLHAVTVADAGGVYAVANLRGGGEFGEEWHRGGMLERKQNTFDDHQAAAEWLIANGYTCPEKLAASGGSNGGLLVGAALTQRPELFRAILCGVPLLDMVRYHQFLVARFWVPEYGSSDDPGQFRTLLAYSPYHHVTPGTAYPAVMFVTGDADTRVAPLHARKMAALLQSATSSDRPILLHYEVRSGHSAGKPVSHQLAEEVDKLSFLLSQLGAVVDP